MTRPHLSPTQMDLICRCPEAYRRSYIEGEKIPPGIAMLKGTGVHSGAKTNLIQKKESHRDLPSSDIIDAAVAAFDTEAKGGISLTRDEHAIGFDKIVGKARDDVADMAMVHAKQQAPDYQPVYVEQRVRILLPNASHDLLGIVDVADDKDRVTDFKTAGRSKTQDEADNSVQLTTYAASFVVLTGRPPTEVRLDNVVQTKTKTYRSLIVSHRTDDDFAALARRINVITSVIQAGIFIPATPGAWWCHPKWCGYWSTCPFVNSERKALAKED
jgi:hypothetical protein